MAKKTTKAAPVAAAPTAAPINKSEVMREYIGANPDCSPKDAAAELTTKFGVEFKPAAISNEKVKIKKAAAGGETAPKAIKTRKPRTVKAATAPSTNGEFNDMKVVQTVLSMVESFGIERTREMLLK